MGRVWKFDSNINTDEIIPARYNITIVPQELAQNVFCEVRPDYASGVRVGDVLVAAENFGCGSSREHAPIAIKASGVACIVAKSYARIFYRNAINIGLPVLECDELWENVEDGDSLSVDLEAGVIQNESTGAQYKATPLPPFILKIGQAGGIVNFLREHELSEIL